MTARPYEPAGSGGGGPVSTNPIYKPKPRQQRAELTGIAKAARWVKSRLGIKGPGLRDHFEKHYSQFGKQVGANSPAQYDLSARRTIQNGKKFSYRDRETGEPRVGYHDSNTGLFTATSQTRKTPTILTHFPLTKSDIRKLPGYTTN